MITVASKDLVMTFMSICKLHINYVLHTYIHSSMIQKINNTQCHNISQATKHKPNCLRVPENQP